MEDTEVLIAGAGPTGLVLALWLTRLGVRVRIVDRNAAAGSESRALAVHARTLELYRQLGLADEVAAAGLRNPAVNLWANGRRRARLAFGDVGRTLTPFPFVLVFPQDRHERLLERHLAAAGVTVERNTELIGFDATADGVRAHLRGPDGATDCAAAWLAGCDGARSTVRRVLDTGFAGGTYEHVFYVADVDVSGPAADGEVHLALEHGDFVLLMAYTTTGHGRLIGTIRAGQAEMARPLAFEDVRQRALDSIGLTVERVHWFSTYRVHHRVANRYRAGRVLLLGDAAHVHSPAGGQGMNTGIGDAVNLAWKLAHVLRGRAPDSLVDTYEAERVAFARKLVETTDRVFGFVTADGELADFVRTRIAPTVVAAAAGAQTVRATLFRMLSQTGIHYHDSPLSAGRAGHVRGGDRLPWTGAGGPDNHAVFVDIGWQVHVYGIARADLEAWCAQTSVALHVFPWVPACAAAGLEEDAAYVVRPDTYVGLADARADPATLAAYFAARGVTPA